MNRCAIRKRVVQNKKKTKKQQHKEEDAYLVQEKKIHYTLTPTDEKKNKKNF